MKRRRFLALFGGAAATWPLAAHAQQPPQRKRVGIVMGYVESDPNGQLQVAAFRRQLQNLGWLEGANITLDFRFAADDADRIKTAAAELLALGPDVMVSNSNVVTSILQHEVRAVPLVFISVSDPVGSGFVANLARPTANITGFANFQPTMGSKWLDLLRQIAPEVRSVGVLYHPEAPNFGYLRSAEEAGPGFNIKVIGLPIEGRADVDGAIAKIAAESNSGMIVTPNVVTFANAELIIKLAASHRIPAIYPFALYSKAGGLISYGFDAVAQFREGAGYVDKLLKGAKPTELPVQFPTKFDVVVNLKTAKALGLTITESFLALTDEVIE